MQPLTGINPVRLGETDIAGSRNIMSAYQGGERGARGYTRDGKREKGVTRYWNWQELGSWLKEGERQRKEEGKLPDFVTESFEVTPESYLCGWNGVPDEFGYTERKCRREWLGKGRSDGGMVTCPRNKVEGVLMCGVCDYDGVDYKKEG
ncbi:hypothetical protein TrRE_jg455 [Triparma retinervis]|uniref:Uncharacterized protein n=1 Tax=Triparma retinervis TaxID=2557542 RepID=A0A9W7AFT8_9STRA|nr:hypothetical protein TrRE_jg455 [Triparma retinervis]